MFYTNITCFRCFFLLNKGDWDKLSTFTYLVDAFIQNSLQCIYIYIYAFSRRFYPNRLTIAFRLYIFNEPHRNNCIDTNCKVLTSAVKPLIVINCIPNKSFCLHNICICIVHIYYVYINIHTYSIYILNIFTCIYINIFIFLYYILYFS